jgi:hypothetical protein
MPEGADQIEVEWPYEVADRFHHLASVFRTSLLLDIVESRYQLQEDSKID